MMTPLVSSEWHEAFTGSTNSNGRLIFSDKVANVVTLPANANLSAPAVVLSLPVNASMPRCPKPPGYILPVAVPSENAEIVSPIVHSVSVNMVSFESISVDHAEQNPMKADFLLCSSVPFGGTGHILTVEIPAPLVHPFGISGVNKCVGSNAAVSGAERYANDVIIDLHSDSPPSVTPRAVSAAPGFVATIIPPGCYWMVS